MKSLKELSSLEGRYCLITGACGYLGRTFAESLAELGANLLLVDIHGSDFSYFNDIALKHNIKFFPFECDLENRADRERVICSINKLEHGLSSLINNAAFTGTSNLDGWIDKFENQTLDTWNRAVEVNLTSCFHFSQGLCAKIRSSIGGNIINVSSIYGEFGPDWRLYEGTSMGNPAAYASSKGGLIQLTRWMATTLAPEIRVNAISPGGIYRSQSDSFVAKYESRTPLGRMAKEEDFKGIISFLASDLSAYVTGQNMRIDGGWGTW